MCFSCNLIWDLRKNWPARVGAFFNDNELRGVGGVLGTAGI